MFFCVFFFLNVRATPEITPLSPPAPFRSSFFRPVSNPPRAKTAEICPLVVATRSGDGVSVLGNGQRVDIPVETVTPVDATGAGDQFAAGFLYGLATNRDLEVCAKMGNLCAAEVIGHVGPRPQIDMMKVFQDEGLA